METCTKYFQRFSTAWTLKLSPTSYRNTDKDSKVNGRYFWNDKRNSTELQSQNITCLIKMTSCLRDLDRQGLSLNKHGKDQDSNFKQFVNSCTEDDPVCSKWLNSKSQNFPSQEIQNKILKEMSWSILCDIAESIKKAEFYGIMVDNTRTYQIKNRPFFCVCWVDENLFSYEYF